jgi:hypothetical protein
VTARRAGAAAVTAMLAAVALTAPDPAAASGIAYIKEHNVWLSSPDGSVQRQVTTDGTPARHYNWPSQADDGTILAKLGDYFVRMRPDGTRIGDPVPGIGSDVQHSGNLTVMAGPAAPRISPDGTRFAYWISARSLVTCPIWNPGCSFQDTDYTLVSRVDRFTPPEEFGAVRDYRDPSWIDNDRLLVTNHGAGLKEGAISQVGAGEPGILPWYDNPPWVSYIGQSELARSGDKLATLGGSESFGPAMKELYLYGVSGYPAPPEPRCMIDEAAPPSRKFLQPAWSPEGDELAVGESDGIHVFGNIPDLRTATVDCGQITERVLLDGSAAFWSPVSVQGPPPPPPPPGPPVPPVPPTDPAPPLMTDVAVVKRQKGSVVRVRLRVLAARSTVRARLRGRAGRRVMGSATEQVATPGPLALDVPLNRRGRKAMRAAGRLRLSLRLAVVGADGSRATARRPVVLRG